MLSNIEYDTPTLLHLLTRSAVNTRKHRMENMCLVATVTRFYVLQTDVLRKTSSY